MATGSLVYGYGHWMPERIHLRRAWLSTLLQKISPRPFPDTKFYAATSGVYATTSGVADDQLPPAEELRQLIEKDSSLYMLANAMFAEVPTKHPYDRDASTLNKQVRSYKTMLHLFEALLTRVPEWFTVEGEPSGLVGFPFNIILDWPMGTASGRHFFLDPRVNTCLMKMLNQWGDFLKDPYAGTKDDPKRGNQVLKDAKWNSDAAIKQLEEKANQVTRVKPGDHTNDKTFTQLFLHPADGDKINFFNYKCWDQFFTRKFRDGIRPIANSAIVNACESFPLAFDTDVSRRSTFWLKGAPYSLRDMFGSPKPEGAQEGQDMNEYVEKFVGGAVYQAFLSADSYHCWNAPVDGKVIFQGRVEGSYYAETPDSGFGGSSGPDPAGPDLSQRYISHVAARGVLVIDTTDYANIGWVAFIPIGMAEVSTIQWEADVVKGKVLKKGDLIGAFHGGGSTHCLLFQRDAMEKLKFNPKAEFPETASVNLGVNSMLADRISV